MFPAQDLQQITPPIRNSSSQYISDPTLKVLMLCARSINIHSSTASHTHVDHSPVQSWRKQAQALQAWCDARRETFRTLLDIEMPTSEPTVARFPPSSSQPLPPPSQTASTTPPCYFYSDTKPRTVPALSSGSSSVWHARRICAIAVSNGSNTYWDPCLLSCLFLAARVMTYVPQQVEIVRCFEEASMRTGWRVQAKLFVDELQNIWSLT